MGDMIFATLLLIFSAYHDEIGVLILSIADWIRKDKKQ